MRKIAILRAGRNSSEWEPDIFGRAGCDISGRAGRIGTLMLRAFTIGALTVLSVGSALASPQVFQTTQQPSTRLQRIGQNTKKLLTTFQLDRDQYLPGETMEMTITIRNPGETPLEARKPDPQWWFYFAKKWDPNFHERLSLIGRDDEIGRETGWLPYGVPDRAFDSPDYEENVPYVILQPGQVLTAKFHSYEMRHDYAPVWPGTYRMGFPGSRAEYEVMAPAMEHFNLAELREPFVRERPNGTTESLKLSARVFVLGSQGRHFVCIARYDNVGKPRIRSWDQEADGTLRPEAVRALAPYIRVGESDRRRSTCWRTRLACGWSECDDEFRDRTQKERRQLRRRRLGRTLDPARHRPLRRYEHQGHSGRQRSHLNPIHRGWRGAHHAPGRETSSDRLRVQVKSGAWVSGASN